VLALRSLARRIEAASAEADELEREILKHVRASVPELLHEPGVGPIVAAQLIVTWSHRDRVRSEAAFAALPALRRYQPRPVRRSATASAAAGAREQDVAALGEGDARLHLDHVAGP
jgi:transposase